MIKQVEFQLPPYKRGFHLITSAIEKEIGQLPETGTLHVFIKHSSAGLTLNENADPSVRKDFESIFNKLIPEKQSFYTHDTEGSDDMPAHIKATLTGTFVTVPISRKKLNLGTWQGIYLCEFRDNGGSRNFVATIFGE
jgi:secondary thiamine-phosphate synthase enzyme